MSITQSPCDALYPKYIHQMENVTSRSVCVVVCGCVPGMLDVGVILSLLHKQNKLRNALFTPEQKKGLEKGGRGAIVGHPTTTHLIVVPNLS